MDATIYDINKEEGNGQANTKLTGQQRANNEPITTNKNVKKEKNEKKPLPAEAVSIADMIISHVREMNPNAKNISDSKLKATRQAWASEIDRAARLDGRTFEELAAAFEWARRDSFWRTNILSGGTLREKYDKLYIKMNGATHANKPIETKKESEWVN